MVCTKTVQAKKVTLILKGEVKQKYAFFKEEDFTGDDFYIDGYITDVNGNKYYNENCTLHVSKKFHVTCKIKNSDIVGLLGYVKPIQYNEFDAKTKMVVSSWVLTMKGENLPAYQVNNSVVLYNANGKKLKISKFGFNNCNEEERLPGVYWLSCTASCKTKEQRKSGKGYEDAKGAITLEVIPRITIKTTKSSITVKKVKRYEYSIDGKNWTKK